MKQTHKKALILTSLIGLCLALTGCARGKFQYGAPPTALEQKLFDVQTNYFPVVKTVTNIVPVTQYETNTVTVTKTNENLQIVNVLQTNVVPITVQKEVPALVTNQQPIYTYNEGANEAAIKAAGGAAGAPFGVGGLVSGALGLLFGAWRWVRSAKVGAAAATLAQEIETARSFIKMLPNGAQYDAALVQWLSDHQKETNVVSQVMDILSTQVQSQTADVAAQQIKAAIAALNPNAAAQIASK